MIKRIFVIGLIVVMALGIGEPFFASTSVKIEEEELYKAYIVFSERLDEMDISASICVEEFISGYTWNTDKMLEKYVDELIEQEKGRAKEYGALVQTNVQQGLAFKEENLEENENSTRASIVKKWYDNIGTDSPRLPRAASYDKYSLMSYVQRGDIIQETYGLVAIITGHIAIVEGKFYDSTYKQFYFRTIEAGIDGVVHGVLDDTRVSERGVKIHYVPNASSSQITQAINFCNNQIGKPYGIGMLLAPCDYSSSSTNWYCTELVWAAYYNAGINLNGAMLPFNIFMPASLGSSFMLSRRSSS